MDYVQSVSLFIINKPVKLLQLPEKLGRFQDCYVHYASLHKHLGAEIKLYLFGALFCYLVAVAPERHAYLWLLSPFPKLPFYVGLYFLRKRPVADYAFYHGLLKDRPFIYNFLYKV